MPAMPICPSYEEVRSNRADQRRESIMGGGRIAKVDITGGAEARSETPAGSKAALVGKVVTDCGQGNVRI